MESVWFFSWGRWVVGEHGEQAGHRGSRREIADPFVGGG